ncbi:Vacuolar ATPase assembly integral membrane protein VPH2 [Spathaspora sp. JA1]|nr:Vacuolar ATPase assembly integral membrane protein VPH2 [Spathaspora sp. JA1]
MTRYHATDSLKELIESTSNIPSSLKSRLLNEESLITHTDLIEFYKLCKPTDTLLDLIKLTKLSIPNKNITPIKAKTKEYLELMERLRLEEKEREYKRLINPSPEYETLYDVNYNGGDEEQLTMSQMHKELKHQLTTIVNILISVGSVAYTIWYWTESSWGLPVSYRLLLSIFFGLLVLIAEVVVYLGYLNKIDDARVREKKKKEVKKVIKTVDLKKQQ